MDRRQFLKFGLGALAGVATEKVVGQRNPNEKTELKKRKEALELELQNSPERRIKMDEGVWEQALIDINYQELLKQSSEEFGVDPYKRIGYQQYIEFNRDIEDVVNILNQRLENIDTTKKKKYPPISRGIVSASILQEGLAFNIDDKGYDPERKMESFGKIGMDYFAAELPMLIKEELLDTDFKKKLDYTLVEDEPGTKGDDEPIKPVVGTERTLMEGFAAMLVQRRNFIIDSIGLLEWNKFSLSEQSWLIYAAYNWGPGNIQSLLKEHLVIIKTGGEGTRGGPVTTKRTPLTDFMKHHDGKESGRVTSVEEFIHKNQGMNYRPTRIWRHGSKTEVMPVMGDFHNNASQVAVSATVSDAFFDWLDKHRDQIQ
jgi:hypothetical protein